MITGAVWNEQHTFIAVTTDDGTVKYVPDDMANADRQAIEQWAMVKGNMIEPYTPPPEAAPK
jgi:hypothetical protein